MINITESPSEFQHLDKMSVQEILEGINQEDAKVYLAVKKMIPLIEAIVGPEFVTGSTRLKAGTAQKLILNMLSTTLMIKMGRVKGNKMVNMQPTNNKLVERGTRMIVEELQIPPDKAKQLLLEYGSVKKVLDAAGH